MDGCSEWSLRGRAGGTFRLRIMVCAGGHVRFDKPVEVELDLAALTDRDGRAEVGRGVAQVLEVDGGGAITDPAVPFQFDRDPLVPTRGTLAFLMRGATPPDAARYFEARLGHERARPPAVASGVSVAEASDYQGQDSFRIRTGNAMYYYHKAGGGFASMFDQDGLDWISFRPGDGPRGEYRGIPNVINPEGGFHPGSDMCTSRLVSQGPLRVKIASESLDGKWACAWDIYPQYARLTMLKAGHPYWVLYEGTPAGKLDEQHQYWIRSDGVRGPASASWEQPLPGLAWVCFGDSRGPERALYLIRHEADGHMDSYWPMQSAMTVFGFGRDNGDRARWCNLTRVPARFTIGFVEGEDTEHVRGTILSAARGLPVSVGVAGAARGHTLLPSAARSCE